MCLWGWGDGSRVKSTYFQSTRVLFPAPMLGSSLTACNSSSRGSDAPFFWGFECIKHASDTQTAFPVELYWLVLCSYLKRGNHWPIHILKKPPKHTKQKLTALKGKESILQVREYNVLLLHQQLGMESRTCNDWQASFHCWATPQPWKWHF